MSFKEKAELEKLPLTLETLEKEQQKIYDDMADPKFYQSENSRVAGARDRLAELEKELEELYVRWEDLEMIRENQGV